MEIFTDAIGQVKLGGKLLPGVFESLEINGDIQIDEVEVKGRSGKVKQVKGYNDSTLQLSIVLDTDEKTDCYNKLETVQSLFRKTDSQAKPVVYSIVNLHANKRKINKVLFTGLKSKETNTSNTLIVALSFVEYETIQIAAEKRVKKPTTATTATVDSAKKIDKKIVKSIQSPATDDAKLSPKVRRLLADG